MEESHSRMRRKQMQRWSGQDIDAEKGCVEVRLGEVGRPLHIMPRRSDGALCEQGRGMVSSVVPREASGPRAEAES